VTDSTIFVIGCVVTALCGTFLLLSVAEFRRLSREADHARRKR